jgi:hypothetical protein
MTCEREQHARVQTFGLWAQQFVFGFEIRQFLSNFRFIRRASSPAQ